MTKLGALMALFSRSFESGKVKDLSRASVVQPVAQGGLGVVNVCRKLQSSLFCVKRFFDTKESG